MNNASRTLGSFLDSFSDRHGAYMEIITAITVTLLCLVPIYTVNWQSLKIQLKQWRIGHTSAITVSDLGNITPLRGFDWRRCEPIPYRPFKTMRHVSMGIVQVTINDWIEIDRGYRDRIQERKFVLSNNPEHLVIGTGTEVNSAIAELFEKVMKDFLPKRYPSIFRLDGMTLLNKVNGESFTVDTKGLDHAQMLRSLAYNVEEDFYIMCPDVDGTLRLRGYIACFPGGFLSPSRVGESICELHEPVPGYSKRISSGADKYLERMKSGQYIRRMNWSLQVDGSDLFRTEGNNYYPAEAEKLPASSTNVDLQACWVRVERQVLTRLPRTKAVIFIVRSYMTSLSTIRDEGNGPILAKAIESMPEALGNYKKRPFWGSAVLPFLKEGHMADYGIPSLGRDGKAR